MIYVAGFLADRKGNVLLVEKKRPTWQAGKLNGIGGKIEEGEEAIHAMRREWKEETGESRHDWRQFCRLHGEGFEVFFYCANTNTCLHELFVNGSLNDVGERLMIIERSHIVSCFCIDNLRWLIPMAFDDPFHPIGDVTNDRKS